MGTPPPQLTRRSGGLEERRKFPTEFWNIQSLKKHVIATNLSYLTFLEHIAYLVTFTITKRKTFTYIFVPFAQLKRLCNISSLLLMA